MSRTSFGGYGARGDAVHPLIASRRHVIRLYAVLATAALPALLDADAIGRAAALHAFADGPHPYLVLTHAGLLYVWAPIVALSACVLFLAPGLLMAMTLNRSRDVGEWVIHALALSLVIVSLLTGAAQAMLGAPFRGAAFGWFVAAIALGCWAIAFWRSARETGVSWPLAAPYARWTVLSMIAVPFFLVIALAPKFHWEPFNGDGSHMFETARRLFHNPLPFWPSGTRTVGPFPGLTTMLFAFPSSWFIRLFGEVEASVRLPFLLYLPALFGAVAAVAGLGRATLGIAERTLIWLNLTTFSLAMTFSAAWDPYSADIADRASADALQMACYLGFVLSFLHAHRGSMLLFAALSYMSGPSGLVLIVFWLAAVVVIDKPRPWPQVKWAAAALATLVASGVIVPVLLSALGHSQPGREHGLIGLLRYFAFLQFTDLRRVVYVAIPAGILPVFALGLVRRQDRTARAMALVAVAHFLLFFVQARIALHYFVPTMLLAVAVAWRIAPAQGRERGLWLGTAAATGAVALALALPANWTVQTAGRVVGETIEDRLGGYERSAAGQLAASAILTKLFPLGWDASVPTHAYGGSPLIWNHYANHNGASPGDPVRDPSINYVMQPSTAPPPPGTRLVADTDGVALFVRSDSVWSAHRALRPATPPGSWWLAVPRSTLFLPKETGPSVVSVVDTLERLGIDMTPILARLGVKR